MYIDEMENNKYFTNNPEGPIYTNNPDDEENMNKNKNKLFFNDDDNNNKIEEFKKDDDTFINQKGSIKNNFNNLYIELSEKPKNDLIEKENNGEQKIKKEENKLLKENDKVEENKNIIKEEKEEGNKKLIEEEKDGKKEILIEGEKEEEKQLLIDEEKEKIENEENKINKKNKIDLQESNKSDESDMIAESLLRGNNSQNQEINPKEKYKACKILLAIFFGQLLALLSVGNGFFVEEIQNKNGIKIPLLLNSTYYFLIFFVYFFISKCRIKKPRLIYIILSLIDTQANFLNIFIFSIIQFDYPFIMNVLSTIWSVIFSLIIIRIYKYLKNHVFGIILCLVGVFSMLLGTFKDINDFVNMFINFNNDIKGILLNLLISILYGLNSVLLEKYISLENEEIKSYCTWLGIFGFFLSLIESFIPKGDVTFEFKIFFIIEKNKLDTRFIIYWVLSSICLAAMTSLSPLYIRKYQATMFNISLTFTIFWSYIIKSFFIEDISKFKWYWLNSLYFVGFIIIIAGTVIFSWKDRIRKNNFGYA